LAAFIHLSIAGAVCYALFLPSMIAFCFCQYQCSPFSHAGTVRKNLKANVDWEKVGNLKKTGKRLGALFHINIKID